MTIFRPAALAQMRSPEQLDQLLRINTPRSWIALVTLLILTVAALGWSFLGSVTTSVQGVGILVRPGGLSSVTAEGTGLVEEIRVGPGQRIEKGQVVARLAQPVLDSEIRATDAEVRRLRDDYEQTSKLYQEGDRLYTEATQQQRKNIDFSLAALERRRLAVRDNLKASQEALAKELKQLAETQTALEHQSKAFKAQVDRIRELRGRGVSTQKDLDAAVRDYDETQVKLRANQTERAKHASSTLDTETKAQKEEDQITESMQTFRNQLATLAKEESERTTKRKEELFAKRQALHTAESKLQLLQTRLAHENKVQSPYAGYVVEVIADVGSIVQTGAPIVIVEEPDHRLEVVVYLPAADGKKIEPGMRLHITPSTVKREEFGYIVGTVESAGSFPVSENAMLRLLPNKSLVQELTKQGPTVEAFGAMARDADAPSGFQWSSGLGPPLTIHSGTLCSCSVLVREQKPITLVIPALRKFFGVY